MSSDGGVRFLFATDGSAGAAVALDFVSALPLRHVDEIVVVSHPTFLLAARPDDGVVGRAMERRRRRAREAVESALARLRSGAAATRGFVQDGDDAVDAALRAAEACGADLIVVGSRGLGPLTSLVIGSTARALAMISRVPVLVVRDRRTAPRRVLIAFDGSRAARLGLGITKRLPLPADASVELLNVLPVREWSELGPGMNGELADLRESVERYDEEQAERLLAETVSGTSARAHAMRGPVAETIVARANAIPADLVVLGSRGAHGPRRPFWGSTAERVLVSARCPVLIAPEPSPAPSRGRRLAETAAV